MAWISPGACISACSRTRPSATSSTSRTMAKPAPSPRPSRRPSWPMRRISTGSMFWAAVERIAQKHVGLQILPEHYPACRGVAAGRHQGYPGRCRDVDEILAAWGEAYWFLADILIGREKHRSTITPAATPGGWIGWRDFVVERKQRESDYHHLLHPAPAGWRSGDAPPSRPVPDFLAGNPRPASAEAELQHLQRARRHTPTASRSSGNRAASSPTGCTTR